MRPQVEQRVRLDRLGQEGAGEGSLAVDDVLLGAAVEGLDELLVEPFVPRVYARSGPQVDQCLAAAPEPQQQVADLARRPVAAARTRSLLVLRLPAAITRTSASSGPRRIISKLLTRPASPRLAIAT